MHNVRRVAGAPAGLHDPELRTEIWGSAIPRPVFFATARFPGAPRVRNSLPGGARGRYHGRDTRPSHRWKRLCCRPPCDPPALCAVLAALCRWRCTASAGPRLPNCAAGIGTATAVGNFAGFEPKGRPENSTQKRGPGGHWESLTRTLSSCQSRPTADSPRAPSRSRPLALGHRLPLRSNGENSISLDSATSTWRWHALTIWLFALLILEMPAGRPADGRFRPCTS